MAETPPVPGDKLKDILPPELQRDDQYNNGPDKKTKEFTWDPKYGELTRGDLMRLSGWMQKDAKGKPDEEPSPRLKALSATDFMNLAAILQRFNRLTYGHNVFFCCTCG